MKLHYLGHSEVLVEMENRRRRKDVRILCDSWLSNYAFGDFLARNPRLNFDFADFPSLDGVFLSHPHCDHFDPYTLVPLFRAQRPAILLPETCLFLKDLLNEYLGRPEIVIVHSGEDLVFRDLALRGNSFVNTSITNEDDVMTLCVRSDNEALFLEFDCAVPETPDAHNELHRMFSSKKYTNRVYVVVRNELEALYTAYDAREPAERKRRIAGYRSRRRSEMAWEYAKFEEGAGFPEIWQLPYLIKVFTGQGMVFPPEVEPDFLKLSAPFPLSEIASLEKQTAREYGRTVGFAVHEPGRTAEIHGGRMETSQPLDWCSDVARHPVQYDPALIIERSPVDHPMLPQKRDAEKQHRLILDLLNHRFLPFQTGNLDRPLKRLILEAGGCYTIQVQYGTDRSGRSRYYGYRFGGRGFEELTVPVESAQERYWANDLEDFLEGRQDMFSGTLHSFTQDAQANLWACLGMPFLNSDVVAKKLEFHFERAAQNQTVDDWVVDIARNNFIRQH